MQNFWRDTPRRFVNSTEILQALKILLVFSPITYTLWKCGVVRADVEMLHLVALYPHLTIFEELHCHYLRGQAVQEDLNCMTLRMKAEIRYQLTCRHSATSHFAIVLLFGTNTVWLLP